jgi:hypothetical protein
MDSGAAGGDLESRVTELERVIRQLILDIHRLEAAAIRKGVLHIPTQTSPIVLRRPRKRKKS